jgi:hypothetical protein
LIFLLFKNPSKKPFILTILSATVPFIIGYAYVIIENIIRPTESSNWAVSAMWEMSFFIYVAAVILSTIVSLLIPKKTNLVIRAILGAIAAPLVFLGLNFVPF